MVDRCAGRRLADWLLDNGHDVLYANDLGPDPGDRILLERAQTENRVLVTLDKDFGELIYLHGLPHAGLIRLPDLRASLRIALVDDVINRYAQTLEQGAMITILGGRIRVSHSPEQ